MGYRWPEQLVSFRLRAAEDVNRVGEAKAEPHRMKVVGRQ